MEHKQISIGITVYEHINEMEQEDIQLIAAAQSALDKSYSPYSGFKVASAALLYNGQIVSAANQENASYPVCVCAEVVMMSACSAMYPGIAIRKVAITTRSTETSVASPKAPCGQCRQTLLEYENRFNTKMELLLCGSNDQVYKVGSVKDLLPLYFSGSDL